MPRVTGSVSAEFSVFCGGGTPEQPVTQLLSSRQSYPLKIAKTFAFDQGQLGVYLMDASPGILAGDKYELEFVFGRDTNVFMTNQSYTKVHPARTSDELTSRPSAQSHKLTLEAGAYAEYLPEPLMLYSGAHFSSEMKVAMASGSSLFLSDIVCPGRTHRGEIFQYEYYQNKLLVTYDGETIFSAKQRIIPGRDRLNGIGSWDQYTHLGTQYLFSDRVNRLDLDSLREQLEASAERAGGLWWGVSRTYKHGIAVTAAGHKVFPIQRLLEDAWGCLRRELFEMSPLAIPK